MRSGIAGLVLMLLAAPAMAQQQQPYAGPLVDGHLHYSHDA